MWAAFVAGLGDCDVYRDRHCANDAHDTAAVLRELGYAVDEVVDVDRATLEARYTAFATALPDDATAVVYVSGPAVHVGDDSLIVPVDGDVSSAAGDVIVLGRGREPGREQLRVDDCVSLGVVVSSSCAHSR